MDVGSGSRGSMPPWIFIRNADKVESGLTVLFFDLVFPLPPLEIFLPTPLFIYIFIISHGRGNRTLKNQNSMHYSL